MATFEITADSYEARIFMEYMRTLPFVKEKKSKKEEKFERIPGLAYTREERIAEIDRAMEDYRAGRYISHEEVFAPYRKWM